LRDIEGKCHLTLVHFLIENGLQFAKPILVYGFAVPSQVYMNDAIEVGRVMSKFVRRRWNGKESVAMILANLGMACRNRYNALHH